MISQKHSHSRSALVLLITATTALFNSGCDYNKTPNPSGTLEATEVDIASTIPGRVLETRFELGEKVSKDDTLLTTDVEILILQRRQTEVGKKAVAAQRLVLGDGISQAKRNLEFLTQQTSRIDALVKEGSAQQQQLDELTARRDVAQEQHDAANHQLSALAVEEEKLAAALALIDRQLEEGVLLAPLNGTVILKAIEPGEIVTPGKVLLKIADISRLELRIFIGAEDLAKVKVGDKMTILVDALPGEKLTGSIIWIAPESEFTPKNAQTRDARLQLVYAVKLSVENSDGRLHIGMPAEVDFQL
jgi:HlyD family secretion protein